MKVKMDCRYWLIYYDLICSQTYNELNLCVFWSPETSEVTTQVNTQWPDIEEIRKLPFDPNPRDPKFRKASPVYTEKMPKCSGTFIVRKVLH